MTIPLIEEKQTRLFADALDQASVPAEILMGSLNEPRSILETVIGVSNVEDWALRHRVLDVAAAFEADQSLTVLCYFRAVD